MSAGTLGRAAFPALGTTAVVLATDQAAVPDAERMLRAELDRLDRAASRFRSDSEIVRLAAQAGRWTVVSPLLAELIAAALRSARLSDGLVDPTVGAAVVGLGYDRDFARLDRDDPRPARGARPAPGWWRIQLDRHRVLVPRRISLDLGATAKAYAADRAAERIGAELGCGVLVSLGGDLAVAGTAPDGGWLVGIEDGAPVVTVHSGGLATSSTARRTWRRAGQAVHHIVDPRTGRSADPVWRTVSVAAATCLDANTASTAAIVLGAAAPDWLSARRLPARLAYTPGRRSRRAADATAITVAGWPA
jgi:thiamine biosynthesis lipoprotein